MTSGQGQKMRSTSGTVAVFGVLALMVAMVGCGQQADGGGDPQAAGDEADGSPDARAGEEGETLTGEFQPLEENTEQDISGEATLTRTRDRTRLSVDVRGLQPEAVHRAHLHEGTCADRSPHYQNDPEGPEEPPNELWPSSDPDDPTAGLQADADGLASGEGTADWRAEGPLSVFVHAPGGHDMLACADLG